MNKATKIIIVIALIAVVGIVIAIKQQEKNSASTQPVSTSSNTVTIAENVAVDSKDAPKTENLPQMIDLGAGKCVPCKLMKPILDELKRDYKEQFKVTFIDVWENPEEARKYKINLIPTQIFYDASGKELSRHEGFFSKEDILGKWKELNIDVQRKGQ
ncbi:MAG: thioredoxin family protein [Planctomycetes bacterium]|nr:thioredoxin family protein [Planctomycetota bacterium]